MIDFIKTLTITAATTRHNTRRLNVILMSLCLDGVGEVEMYIWGWDGDLLWHWVGHFLWGWFLWSWFGYCLEVEWLLCCCKSKKSKKSKNGFNVNSLHITYKLKYGIFFVPTAYQIASYFVKHVQFNFIKARCMVGTFDVPFPRSWTAYCIKEIVFFFFNINKIMLFDIAWYKMFQWIV